MAGRVVYDARIVFEDGAHHHPAEVLRDLDQSLTCRPIGNRLGEAPDLLRMTEQKTRGEELRENEKLEGGVPDTLSYPLQVPPLVPVRHIELKCAHPHAECLTFLAGIKRGWNRRSWPFPLLPPPYSNRQLLRYIMAIGGASHRPPFTSVRMDHPWAGREV